MTMRGISRAIAEALDTNVAYKALCTTELGFEFNYYINVDLSTQEEVALPYFSIVTYNDLDDKEVQKAFKTIFLIGIQRDKPTKVGNITEEPTLEKLENIVREAMSIIAQEIRTFGIQGDKNIKISYVNMYVPNPEGEDDLQMQVDIEFEQDKFLSC